MIFAPLSFKNFTVGKIAWILVSSVTFLSASRGTFTSTLINALLPWISPRSLIDFFISLSFLKVPHGYFTKNIGGKQYKDSEYVKIYAVNTA